jgi:predicted amidohydrolase YtcJ
MHAIGDEAARLALDAIDASDGPGMARARVEHAQTLEPGDIRRFAGRIASMQPLHKTYDARSAVARLGPDRMDRFFAFRALTEAGAILAFGSDWPIVSPDPIAGMAAAIIGRDLDGRVVRGEENLSPAEALAAYTTGAARCLGLDGHGTLAVGGPADLVVLDRDPLALDWERERPRVVATIAGGRATFVADDGPAALRE